MEHQPMPHGQGPSITNAAASNSAAGDCSENHEDNVGNRKIKDRLFEKVMNGEWHVVIDMYRSKKAIVQMARITRSKETALHVAISSNKIGAAVALLDLIDYDAIESMTNDRDENPLHLAASLGQVKICKLMVERDLKLAWTKNVIGETPLFLAARHGKKEAFYALHPECRFNSSLQIIHDITHCKKEDGHSILHAAIEGDYFDLAFQIANWYPDLCYLRNERGESPLHLLACKPSAFRSGCHLGPLQDLIYHCIPSGRVKVESPSNSVDEYRSHGTTSVPENYRSCFDVLNMFVHLARGWKDNIKDVAKQILPMRCTAADNPLNYAVEQQIQNIEAPSQQAIAPEEMPPTTCFHRHLEDKAPDDKDSRSTVGDEMLPTSKVPAYPPNYYTFLQFLQGALELFIFFMGLGYFHVHKIREMKRRHTLAFQLMKSLVRHSKAWEYADAEPGTSILAIYLDSPPNIPSEQTLQDKENIRPMDTKGYGNQLEDLLQSLRTDIKVHLPSLKTDIMVRMEKIISEITEIKGKKVEKEVEKTQLCTPFLIAAKMGLKEMVEEILDVFPVAIWDQDKDKKNVVLLAVENKHPNIYDLLLTKCSYMEGAFRKVDSDGNSALHLAAIISKTEPWRIPGAALQMHWELKWYKFIKASMPRHFFTHRNEEGKTSREVFAETHMDMVKGAGKWLTNTSQACSVVAALIATVAYASATTVPGGSKEGTGIPNLRDQPIFNIFTISSLVALTCSVTSLTMFVSILTSRHQISDFLHNLPTKLILGLTSLFISIAAMLVSFCAGHFFDLGDRLRHTAFPIYVLTCLPVTIYALAQFPLYFDLIKSTTISVPKRNYEITSI